MRRLLLALVVVLVAAPATQAGAKTLRCDQTRGQELAHSSIVKVYKVKQGATSTKYRYAGCAKPRGVVAFLTQTFTGSQVKLVAKKGAYVAFTRTISGQDTISVVDARTGRQRKGLFPPDVEFDTDPATPQVGAAKLNGKGELVASYVGLGSGESTDSTTYIYAFDASGNEQLVDLGPSAKVPPKAIAISGETVSWTNNGVRRTATIGQVSLSIIGAGTGKSSVTTTPDSGIGCQLMGTVGSGPCVGSFTPNTGVEVTATGAPGSTIRITGGCTGTHLATPGDTKASVATCTVSLNTDKSVTVTTT